MQIIIFYKNQNIKCEMWSLISIVLVSVARLSGLINYWLSELKKNEQKLCRINETVLLVIARSFSVRFNLRIVYNGSYYVVHDPR